MKHCNTDPGTNSLCRNIFKTASCHLFVNRFWGFPFQTERLQEVFDGMVNVLLHHHQMRLAERTPLRELTCHHVTYLGSAVAVARMFRVLIPVEMVNLMHRYSSELYQDEQSLMMKSHFSRITKKKLNISYSVPSTGFCCLLSTDVMHSGFMVCTTILKIF